MSSAHAHDEHTRDGHGHATLQIDHIGAGGPIQGVAGCPPPHQATR